MTSRSSSQKSLFDSPMRFDDLQVIAIKALADDDLFQDFLLKDAALSDSIADDVRFLTGKIEHGAFDRSKLAQSKFTDVFIENSHFSNAIWEKSVLSHVLISNSKLTGFQAIDGRWRDTRFKDSKIDLSLFALTKMKNVAFVDCILTEADFQECDLDNVSFRGCNLVGASFLGARFKDVDIRTSIIDHIRISPEQFTGIVIEPSQAAYLIGATGAKVAWLNDDKSECI